MKPINPIIQVNLGIPTRNKDILAYGKSILSAMTNNPHFPSPSPVLSVFQADLAAYDQAETAVATRAAGTVAVRDVKKAKVVQDIKNLRDYVRTVADAATADALSIVESAGFKVKRQALRSKQALLAKDGPVSGSVHLAAKAAARVAVYYWQYSLDGKTWTSSPDTLKSATMVAGLTPGQAYSFRYRTLTRAGASDFSQVVSHIVK
jgi:hypothetical protein